MATTPRTCTRNYSLTEIACVKHKTVPCPPGSTGPGIGKCTQCLAGTYKNITGDSACSNCTIGHFSAAVAAVSNVCQPCSSGTFAAEGSEKCTVLPSTTPLEFVDVFVFRLAITVAEFESQRINFILGLAIVYDVPSENINVDLVTGDVTPAPGSTSRRLATLASPGISVTVSILFATPASTRAPVDLVTINRELGGLQVSTVTSVIRISTNVVQTPVVKGKRRIWGFPEQFFWAGVIVIHVVVIVTICTVIILCCCGHCSTTKLLQPDAPVQPFEIDAPSEDQVYFVPHTSYAPIPIYYV